MKPISKFERKFGKYAIPNLTTILVICCVIGYILQIAMPGLYGYLTLDAYAILHGQIWRLVSWVLIPPRWGNIFLALLMLYFYWSIGTTLERVWGTYRYNVYIFSGLLFTVIGSFVTLAVNYLMYGEIGVGISSVGAFLFSTTYIMMSIFLAFAATFPEHQVLLMYVIPVKVKWLGIADALILIWEFIVGAGALSLSLRAAILFSLLNFIVFFITNRRRFVRSPKQIKRQHEFKREVNRGTRAAVTKHKCAICGRTDESNPELEFRFCSKCNGNYEYCQDHLFSHKHVE